MILLDFQTLHRLAARAVIKDWENGSLDEDRTTHEVFLYYYDWRLLFKRVAITDL